MRRPLRRSFLLPPLVAALPLLLPSGPASGQGWALDLHAGRASFEVLPATTRSTNATVALRHRMDDRLAHLALAAPLASGQLFWGAATGRDRLALRRGRLEVGADLVGQAHLQRDPTEEITGWGVRAEALPMVSASAGPVVAEIQSGGAWYRAEADGVRWSRRLWSSGLRLFAVPDPAVRFGGEARRFQGTDEAYTFLGLSASGARHRMGIHASAGEWVAGLSDDEPSTEWAGGVVVAVGTRTDVRADVRREPFDPLFLSGPRTSWGVGVSVRLGAPGSGAPAAGPERRGPERVIVRLPLAEASSPPYVAGDFTGWDPVPMHRHGDHWRLELSLEPGAYRYSFRTSDGEWFVPEGVPGRRDDGMGGWVAVMVVE